MAEGAPFLLPVGIDEPKDREALGPKSFLSAPWTRGPGLKVVGRASALSFKGKPTSIPEIARQLGVTQLVDGTVLQEGPTVRITAKLITADGFDGWGPTHSTARGRPGSPCTPQWPGSSRKSFRANAG